MFITDWFKRLFGGGGKEIPYSQMQESINEFQDAHNIPEDEMPEMMQDDYDPNVGEEN